MAQSHVVPMAGTPCQLTPIATEEDFNHQISQLPPSCLAAIYFHAPWAEPCLQMNTILTTLATTYQATNPPRIVFLSLNAEELSDVSERYDVTQVPLVVLQKDGKVLEGITGTDPTKVRNAVEKHVNGTAGDASLPPAQSVSQQANGNGTAKAPHAAAAGEANGEQSKEALNQRLSELVKAAPVMLFMKGTPSAPQCGFSRQTVSILREKGVRYGFFNILADDEVRQGLKEFSEWPTFPQVYVDGELVGGLDILKEEFENDAEFLKSYSVHAQKQAA